MLCPSCTTENTSSAKFCLECGRPFAKSCANCGQAVAPGAKFCVNCGESVTRQPVKSSSPAAPEHRGLEAPVDSEQTAERRLLTILFSDMVGSTAISELLDPEDYREMVAHYRNTVTAVIEKYDGQVANFVGDGIVACFGFPVAHEGSAYAAALAALEIVEAAPGMAGRFANLSLKTQVRVGLHTGFVVAGETGSGNHIEKLSLFGDTPNIAARIQSHASPGQVVVSAATRRLIGSQLVFKTIGPQLLSGVHEPVSLYRVLRPSSPSELALRHLVHPATPMIGRKAEIALVATRWEGATEGDGQVMVVSGEAGIGKSRIVFALDQVLAEGEANRFIMFGSAIYKNSAFYSVRNSFESLMALGVSDAGEVKRQKLDAFLGAMGLDSALVAPPISGLLGFAEDQDAPAAAAFPEREKIRIVNALLQIFSAMSEKTPLLMVIDDAHWIDPSTLDFVSRWIDVLPRRRCLLLLTARPEFESPWKNLAHVTALELNRLSRRESVALIESIAGTRPEEALLKQIVSRTDGVPLFIEELTKMIVEAGILSDGSNFKGDLSHAIPESLQDSLMARLDRLAPAKEVAQVAAAIGRTFSRTVLCRVHGGDEQTIADALSKLIDADLIVLPGGIGEESSCRFRHALVQEAAYQSMLRTSRVKWHGRIAKVLEHDFPETTEREPELLAHHFMLAGGLRQAEMYWLAAARMAMTRSANLEAIEHLSRALECLHQAPVSEDRDRREMDLQIMIAVPLAFVNGYAHQKVRAAYTRARELCRQYGETELLFKVVYGQFRSSLVGGEYAAALESAEFLASIMDEFDDPVLNAAIHRSRGAVLTYLGRPGEALQHLNMGIGIELKMADRNRGLNFDVVDLPVALHAYSAWNNWLCGNSGGAKQAITKALDYAGETEHPFTVSFSLAFASWIYQFLGDEEAVRKTSARLMALSEENAFHFWLGWGRVMNGWARRAELGEKALAMMEQGMEEWRGTASRLGLSYFLYLYADAALSLAQVAKARDVLAEAQAFEVESGEAFWKPELIRLAGEIARAQGDHVACEALLHQAVTAAREMGMRGLQLRAAKSAAHAAKEGRGFVWADAALREALEGMPKDERK